MTKVLDDDSLEEVMLSKVPAKVHAANKMAFKLGREYALKAMAN